MIQSQRWYRIRDWEEHFQKSDLKKTKAWTWIGVPIKHDGRGFRRLMKKNPNLFGAWVLLLQVAAKCPDRGTLVDGDGPLTPEDLELKTDMPAERFAELFVVAFDIGWLEASDDFGATWDASGSIRTRPDASGYIPTTDSTDIQTDISCPSPSGSGELFPGASDPEAAKARVVDLAERVYQAYPRKTGKAAAIKAIAKVLKSRRFDEILEATEAYAQATGVWPEDQRKFIPYPATWFNQGRYDDDRADWSKGDEGGGTWLDGIEPTKDWNDMPPGIFDG